MADPETNPDTVTVVVHEPKQRESRELKNSITIVEKVYHRRARLDPSSYEATFKRDLVTQEQPYERDSLTVGEEWQLLDYGWLKQVGMIFVKNTSGMRPYRIPSKEEILAAAKQILEIRIGEGIPWLIPPNEDFRGTPQEPDRVYVRCQSGIGQYTLVALPA